MKKLIDAIGYGRLLIILFVLGLFILASRQEGLSVPELISSSLVRIGMWGILVLAMVPSVQCGAGLNFGLPIGIVCGQVGTLMAIENGQQGFMAILIAVAWATPLALAAGFLYAALLRRVRGHEMMVGTYAGFSIVAALSIFWVLAPFKSPKLVWPMAGKGVRPTIDITADFGQVIDRKLEFAIGQIRVPTGLILTFALAALFLWWWGKTRVGTAMRWAGANPRFAQGCGIRGDRVYVIGVVMSTVLGAIGMVVYCQSFGRIQLYLAPLFMAFPAVAALLLGGASTQRATVAQAILGTVLFQTVLTVALPVASSLLAGTLSEMTEVARLIVSNGIILYALTRHERG